MLAAVQAMQNGTIVYLPKGATYMSFASPYGEESKEPAIGEKLEEAASGYKNVPDDHDGATYYCPLDGLRLTWHEDDFYCHTHGKYEIRYGGRPGRLRMNSVPR
jgi:hypothetical protein